METTTKPQVLSAPTHHDCDWLLHGVNWEWPLKLYRRDDMIMASAIELLKSLFQSMGSSVHDLRCDVGAGLILRLSHMPGNEASYCTGTTLIAAFPGRSRLQFLITCSMQKWRGKAWEKESHAWCQVDMRVDMRGAMPDEESWGPSCNILPKNLRL